MASLLLIYENMGAGALGHWPGMMMMLAAQEA
jgi:hypothetical protein